MVLYLVFEGVILISTIVLFRRKERFRKKLLEDAIAGTLDKGVKRSTESEPAAGEERPTIIERGGSTCAPLIMNDTGTPDAEKGWKVSDLMSWHVYIYKLQVRFTVTLAQVTAAAEAETYDANWAELYLLGTGFFFNPFPLLSLIAAGSIATSNYHATQTAKGNVVCLAGDEGCTLIPNVDPAIPAERDKAVSAAALVSARYFASNLVQFQLSALATIAGHITVQGITAGASLGASTSIPGIPGTSPGGPTAPFQLNAGVNLRVQLRPSPNVQDSLSRPRAVLIQCVAGESGTAVSVQ